MKVLLHAGVDLSRPGGIETHVRELALGLANRGHEVEIFGKPRRLQPFRMVDRLEPARFDVIHFHGGRWPRALDRHPRVASTLHFCVAAKMATYLGIGRLRTLANLANWRALGQERAVARGSARLIAVAERVRREFARFHGLDPARAVVIPNGYLPTDQPEDRAALRRRLGLDPADPVFLTIGRDDFVKGFDLFARAWKRARAASRSATWITVGGRFQERAPGRLVTGPVPHAEMTSWIATADFGALPSHYEGCGTALLEMLGGRLYTLANDVGIAREVIHPGVNGEILASRVEAWTAALVRLLEHPPLRPAKELDGAFTWPAIVERTERVYRELAAMS